MHSRIVLQHGVNLTTFTNKRAFTDDFFLLKIQECVMTLLVSSWFVKVLLIEVDFLLQTVPTTMRSLNKAHFWTASFVLCKEVVLFGRFKMYWNCREKNLGH